MTITVRKAVQSDKAGVIYAEGQSTPNLRYLERLWDDFTSDDDAPLYVAELDGRIVGVGKFSILYDGSAWLEALRVDKDYQGMGAGKQIYQAYMNQAKLLGVPAVRMYTGLTNAASAGLAHIHGFYLGGSYRGSDLAVTPEMTGNLYDFRELNEDESVAFFDQIKERWAGYMVLNRTFYRINDALARGLVRDHMVYYSEQFDSYVVAGARFMPERGLNIGVYLGDCEKCIDFAVAKAHDWGVNKISIMFPPYLAEVQKELEDHGFVTQKRHCIVMETAR